jgi:hypothetical protein
MRSTRKDTSGVVSRGWAVALIAAFAVVAAVPVPAAARDGADVTADGIALAGSTQPDGNFTLGVVAPAGVTVKFKLNGTYLGQDRTAPYTWPIRTTVGDHSVSVRWEDGNGRSETIVPFSVSGSASPPAATASPSPSPAPSSSDERVTVATSAQLTAALLAARPGQTIALEDGIYTGRFRAAVAGTESRRITLTGSRNAVLTTGSTTGGYGLHVTAPYWNITGLSVSEASKGVVLDGASHTVIDGIDVGDIGAEAVHVRKNSASVIVRNSVIHDTGRTTPEYGEGIYIGSAKSNWASVMGSSSTPDRSDAAQVLNNTITNTTAEGIDIKEGTTGGIVAHNTFRNAGYSGKGYADSWVDVKGNGYRIFDNSGSSALLDAFQVHVALEGWGRSNEIRDNSVLSGVPGYEVRVQSGAVGTVVGCGPTVAAKGLTNIACTP